MDSFSLPARQKLLDFGAESSRLAWAAKDRGEPVGWMSTKFPAEIPAALGLVTCCPESQAAALASAGQGGPLCSAADGLGFCADLCSYSRIGLALAAGCQEGGPRIPLPDFLLCCNNICCNMLQWYQNLARTLDIPLFLLDIPYTAQNEPDAELIGYLRAQFSTLTRRLSAFVGRPWQEEAFSRACRGAVDSALAWQEVGELLKDPLCPWDGMELFDYMPVLVSRRCDPRTAGLLRELGRELAALPRAERPARARLMLEGTPCWPHLRQVLAPLRQANIRITADTITPSLGFVYQDLDGLLRAYCGTINGSTLAKGLADRARLCRERGVDGILMHLNRSCRPWSGVLPQLGRGLAGEGWAVVSFDGDQADPGGFAGAQYATRVQGLLEMLEKGKEAGA